MGGEHPDGDTSAAVADLKAELAAAEAAEAEALADAERARERAAALAEEIAGEGPEVEGAVDPDGEAADQPAAEQPVRPSSPSGRRGIAQSVGLALAALLIGVILTLTGLMLWQHIKVSAQRDQERQLVDAASDGVIALLSIDYNHARADVQRVLDLSTGQFHDDFDRNAEDFVKTAEESRAVTTGKINAAALDVVEGNRARVLLSATSVVTNAKGAKDDARPFRMSVTVTCDGETCKMSDVEFVP